MTGNPDFSKSSVGHRGLAESLPLLVCRDEGSAAGLRRTRFVLSCLSVALLATGCTDVIDGNSRLAPNLAPRPLTGDTINRVLLDQDALTQALEQPFKADTDFPPRFGGAEKLSEDYTSVSPADCLGVSVMLQKSSYGSAKVQTVAEQTWWHVGDNVKVISVAEGVAALPTAADADALFDSFTSQWKNCDGTAMTLRGDVLTYTDKISDVRVANSVLAATISVNSTFASRFVSVPEARAIGIRGNCLVEVKVALFDNTGRSDQGSGDIDTSAITLAHAIMDKISELS